MSSLFGKNPCVLGKAGVPLPDGSKARVENLM